MLIIKGNEKLPIHEVVPTPSFGLNSVLGGGLWTGRFHTFWGNPSAGKSTIALQTLANAQRMGYAPVIIDAEGTITDLWIEKCGVEPGGGSTGLPERKILRGTSVEAILKIVLPEMRKEGKKHAFMFDSINTMVVDKFHKADDAQGGLGIYARSQTFMMQKLAHEVVQNTDNLVILIAQQTMDLGSTNPGAVPKIGNSVNHWSSNVIKFFASQANLTTDRDEKSKLITAHDVQWTVSKSKQRAVMGTKGRFKYYPAEAKVDRKDEIFDIAKRNGILRQAGPWIYYGDDLKWNGRDKFMDEMTDHMWEKIESDLNGKVELDFEVDESVVPA